LKFLTKSAIIQTLKLICWERDASLLPQKGIQMAKKAELEAEKAPVEEVIAAEPATEAPTEEKFAKAGKKSKKHVEEVKAEEERQARKAEAKNAPAEKPKGAAPKVRSILERRGKKYQAAYKQIDRTKTYSLEEALELAVKTNPAKFDATVEAHVRLGVDPRQADQNIRTTVVLPNGNGKTVRVAVFAPLDEAKKAKAAGADIAEDEEFLKSLEKGEINFDVLISTPAYMPKLGKFARVLGPKGLMPNPKAGTVTMDIEKAVKEAKAGKVEYRVDKQSIVHIGLGKTNFDKKALLENATVFFDSLKAQKPASIKGSFVKSVYITTTMGPSIAVENLYN
jgi:large subunit ribosomal protein L1